MRPGTKTHAGCTNAAKLIGICLVILIVLVACSGKRPLHPNYEDLIKNGFYVYVLPETEVQQRKWEEVTNIWGYDFHCRHNDAPNNLYVEYVDKLDQTKMKLIIGPWSEIWDWSKETDEILLDTELATEGKAVFYNRSNNSVALMFEDQFGIRVQIWSNFTITETIGLVNELDYIGPPPDIVDNPWDCSNP